MKELRTLACVLSITTLTLLVYGAFVPGGAAIASPAIRITQPNPGALVQGNVTVSVAYRSASGVNITDLEFFVDKARYTSVKLQTPSAEGTYSFVWNTSGLPAGVHTITAVAYDAKGSPGDVAVSVYVDPDSQGADVQAPTVKLASPPTGSVVRGIVTLIANALDNAGVNMVLFQLNGRLLFATNHPPYRYNWDTTKLPNGPHSIKVYAYDASDNRGESTPVVLTVDNPSGRTLANQRPSDLARPTGQTPAALEGTMAPAPERSTTPTPTPTPLAPAPTATVEGSTPTAPAAKPAQAATAQGSATTPPSAKPAQAPPPALRPSIEMTRKDLPQLPAFPASGTQRPAATPATPPIVARPETSIASRYPDLMVPLRPVASSAGVAAPTSSVTPNARLRPTPATPAAPETRVAMSNMAGGSRSGEFTAAGSREGTAPSAELRQVASRAPEAPRAQPVASAARSDASDRTAPTVAAGVGSGEGVSLSGTAVARADAPSFAGADQRPAQPRSSILPLVDPARVVPELVAVIASVPCSILFPGARGTRLAEPGAGEASAAREVAPVTVDAGAAGTQVVAVATDGTVATLTPGMGWASDGSSRLTTPSMGSAMPLLTLGEMPQSATHVAARPTATQPVPGAIGSRIAAPASASDQPTVTSPASGASGVMVVLMDKRTQRAVPLAVIQPQASEPSAHPTTMGQPRTAPRNKIVVAPRSGAPVSVVYNGKPVDFGSVAPFTSAGMTLTPFRHIIEMQGGVVLWNNLIKQVKATGDGRRIEFTIGNAEALVNNEPVQMDAAPFLKQGRAVVPMSFLRQALDVVVEYDPATGRVTIAAK